MIVRDGAVHTVEVNKNYVWDTVILAWVGMTQPGDFGGSVVISGSVEVTSLPTLATRVDESISDVMYVGEAASGSSPSSASWRIKKIDMSSGIVIQWADGDTLFNNIWSNHLTLSYS